MHLSHSKLLLLYLVQVSALLSDITTESCDAMTSKYRSVKQIIPRPGKHWVGDGFQVYPVFGSAAFTNEISPMLMFDYGEPTKFLAKAGSPRGVGQHPHRGFETVTIAYQGEVEHHDSTGKSGIIKPGDVQWMTAGRGIIHEEYHSKEFTTNGGTLEMCQLWVNLPKKDKMTKPGYQAILNENIPVINLPLGSTIEDAIGSARVIAGELGNTKGAAKTFSPVNMWDIILPKKDSEIEIPYPSDHNCIVFVRRGSVEVMSSQQEGKLKNNHLGPQDVALMRVDGSEVLRLKVNEANTSLVIMGGEPLNEPIAHQGPFVMNTPEEINRAISDYRTGKMGK